MSAVSALLSLLCNLIIVIGTAACLVYYARRAKTEGGTPFVRCLRYYTTLSNLLSCAAAAVMLVFDVRFLFGCTQLPRAVMLLRHTATVSVTVTLLTVLFFLGPLGSYRDLLTRDGFHMHLVGPLAAVCGYGLLEKVCPLTVCEGILWGVSTVALYGALYAYEVLVVTEKRGGWEDFYGFNRGGRWYLSVPAMLLAGALLGLLLMLLHNTGI